MQRLIDLIFYICRVQKLITIYKRNIYGVIGTLIFHILLFASFLLANVNIKGNVKEEDILIEFPDNIPEPEPVEEKEAEDRSEPTPETEKAVNQLTNIASNRLAKENITTSADKFFDADYMKEVEAAKQLRSSVTNNLSKKVVDMSDVKMPVETTEGMDRDSIKNVIYAGESNIVYYLENRYHVSLPVPVYLAEGGGTVIIDIKVNRDGKVVEATPRPNPSINDEQIFLYAREAALRTIFNSDDSAPSLQEGSIHYTFVAQ